MPRPAWILIGALVAVAAACSSVREQAKKVCTPPAVDLAFDRVGLWRVEISHKDYEFRRWKRSICALPSPVQPETLQLPGTWDRAYSKRSVGLVIPTAPDGALDAVGIGIERDQDRDVFHVTGLDCDRAQFDRVVAWLEACGGRVDTERHCVSESAR